MATGGSCRDHKARTVTCGRPVRAEDVRLSPRTPCERHCGHCCGRRTCEADVANGQTVSIDPLNVLAVDAYANRSKGDGDTATWLPPYKPFRCTYVARQIAVEGKYDLWVTAAERDAMTRVVATCPTMALPGPGSASTVAKSPSNQPNRAPRSNLRPPLRRRQVASPNRNCTAARAAVLTRLCAGNLATHASSTATETVSPANDPKLAGRSTADPVSLSQGSPEPVNLMIRAGGSAGGSHYSQQRCAWKAHLVPEPRARWPGPFSHAGKLG